MSTKTEAEKVSAGDGAAIGCVVCFLLVVGFCISVYSASLLPSKKRQSVEHHKMQVEAVEKGFARWKVDAEGRTEFEWIEEK